jgi:tRNA/rRNA methyltransferase
MPDVRPCVVLVRPQMGENIGAAARAMMNFGLADLRLVAPRDGWPNDKALEMSAHASSIIEHAKVVDTLQEAIADRQYSFAATARSRQLRLPCYTPMTLQPLCVNQKVAWVFGPENNGLSNEDVAYCQGIVSIPTHTDNASLNIAQSVVILGYQWFIGTCYDVHPSDVSLSEGSASAGEVEKLFLQLDAALASRHFYKTSELQPVTQRNLRTILSRAQLSSNEVKLLHGVISVLQRSN